MAEIHVQTKKPTTSGTLWIWILVGLLIVAAVTWFVVKDKETAPAKTTTPGNPTSQLQGNNGLNALKPAA